MEGWIKVYRKLTEWEWYHDKNVSRVFLHLLLTANYEDKRWQGKAIQRGQLATSLVNLAFATTLSVQQVRTALNKLKSTNEITIKSTNGYSLITICKYESYQDTDEAEQHATQHTTQQTDNKRITNEQQTDNNNIRNKEIKKERKKEEKKNIYGEFSNVKLTSAEYERLKNDFGNELEGIINYLSAYIVERHYTSYSHNLAIRRWVVSAYREQKQRTTPAEADKTTTTEQKPQRLVGPGTFEVNGITVRLGEDEYINAQGKRHYYYTVSGKRYNSEEKGFPDVPLTAPARIYNSDGTIYLRDGQCWGQLG